MNLVVIFINWIGTFFTTMEKKQFSFRPTSTVKNDKCESFNRHKLNSCRTNVPVPNIKHFRHKNDIPWLDSNTLLSTIESFDRELLLFIKYIRPTEKSIKQRNNTFKRYNDLIISAGHTASLFGSSRNHLFLPSSDLDIVVISRGSKSSHKKTLLKLKKKFLINAEFIDCAVPLLKFVDQITGIKVDISCNEGGCTDAISVALHMAEQLKGFTGLVFVLKQFLVNRGLDSNQSFGIGGYGLVLWVGSFLRIHDSIYERIDSEGAIMLKKLTLKGNPKGIDLEDDVPIGIIFLHFLHFFGFCFDYHRVALAPGGSKNDSNRVIIAKSEIESKHCFRLAIMDPLDEFNNVTSGSRRTNEIVACFRDAYNSLLELFDPKQNVLERGFLASILNVPEKVSLETSSKISLPSLKRCIDNERGVDERVVKRSAYHCTRRPRQIFGKLIDGERVFNYDINQSQNRSNSTSNCNLWPNGRSKTPKVQRKKKNLPRSRYDFQ